jgi:uncharacterized protein
MEAPQLLCKQRQSLHGEGFTYMPLIIDLLDFARHAGAHHGKIVLSEFERLHDYLTADGGELQYAVTGALDKDANPVLQITVRGEITLRCQRCLGELEHKLDLSTVLRLAKNEHELARLDEDESVDCILAAGDTDVLTLIEDEILLSLPSSPRHNEGECSIAGLEGRGIARENPLTALAGLKKLH